MWSRQLRASLRTRFLIGAVVLIACLIASTAFTLTSRRETGRTRNTDLYVLRPAQAAASALTTAWINQETGERGYLLGGDPILLQPFMSGTAAASSELATLHHLLAGYPAARSQLVKVENAGHTWRTRIAEPEIAARRASPSGPASLTLAAVLHGKRLFDLLRVQLAALDADIASRITATVRQLDHQQDSTDTASLVTAGLAVASALIALMLLYTMLTRPLRRLLRNVAAVAGGDYQRTVRRRGPGEIGDIADAVDNMREQLLSDRVQLSHAQHQLGVADERERLAADLHDVVIQRVYALGLALQQSSLRGAVPTDVADPLLDEIDGINRELRGVILHIGTDSASDDMATRVARLARDCERACAIPITIDLIGPVHHLEPTDQTHALLAVLREALSNVARHSHATSATTRVTVDDTTNPPTLQLQVLDNGDGVSSTRLEGHGLRNMATRATRLHGAFTMQRDEDWTVLTWSVPLS